MAMPSQVRPWLQAMAGSVNTQPEFLLLGALTVTSCLMGPESISRYDHVTRNRAISTQFAYVSLGQAKPKLIK